MPQLLHDPRLVFVRRSSTRPITKVFAWMTAASLVLGLRVEALAAPPEPSDPAPESDTAKAESIFRRGQIQYETADYVGAIELWTQAYGLVESTPENAAIQALLIFNLAQAHVKAFELDDDAIHLKMARSLLDSYRSSLEMLYDDASARVDEQAKVDEKLVEIAKKLDEVEAAKPKPEPEPKPEVDAAPPARSNPGNPQLFAGVSVAVLGVATGGVMITLGAVKAGRANDISDLDPLDLAGREEQFTQGARGNALMITGAVLATVLIPTGIALIVAGSRRNAEARSAQARVPILAPSFGAGQAGLVLSGRF